MIGDQDGEQVGVSEEEFEAAREVLSRSCRTRAYRFTRHRVLWVQPLSGPLEAARQTLTEVFGQSQGVRISQPGSTYLLAHVLIT